MQLVEDGPLTVLACLPVQPGRKNKQSDSLGEKKEGPKTEER